MKFRLFFLFSLVLGFVSIVHGSEKNQPFIAYLGVYTSQVDPNLSHQLNLPVNLYLNVQKVEKGSPAEKSGIQQFDLLLQLDDQILINQDQLKYLVRSKKPHEEVTLSYLRRGVKKITKLKLGEIRQPYESRNHNKTLNNDLFSNRNPLDLNGFFSNDPSFQDLILNHGRFKQINPKDDSEDDPLHQKQVGNSFFHQSSQNQVMISDEKGTLEWTEKDGQKSLRATDSNGKVIFDGPIDTEEERKMLSPELRERLRELEVNQLNR